MQKQSAVSLILVQLLIFNCILSLFMVPLFQINHVITKSEMSDSKTISIVPASSTSNEIMQYSRQAVYGYANQWYNARNIHYYDFSGSGGDCANFVSQCLIAGGISLHKGTDGTGYGVYPDDDRPSTYSNGTIPYCDYLNSHLRNYQTDSVIYVTDTNASIPLEIAVGDVVIFGNKSNDKYKHAMVVVWKDTGDIGLTGHSSDIWNRSFWTELGYFSCATFYHIKNLTANFYHFRVTATTLNVRVGPGKNGMATPEYYDDIGDLHQGEEYIAFEFALDESGDPWWHFWFDDRTAWCAAWLTTNVTNNHPIEIEITDVLNVRDGPGTGYNIVGQVYDGMRFVANSKTNDWVQYWYGGTSLYSHRSYMILLNETHQWVPTPNPAVKTVMAYLPYWVSYNQNFTPLTHVAWFSLEMNTDGTINTKHGWPVISLVDKVHAANRKIVVTATLMNAANIHTLLSTPSYRTIAITNLLTEVQNGNADGISIDFEHPTDPTDEDYLVAFMNELNATFKAQNANYHISIATPSVDWWGTYNYTQLTPHLDAFFLMGYGYYYSGSPNAGPTAPLIGGSYNLNYSVNDHLNKGVPPSKLILGLPFYGYDYPISAQTKQATASDDGIAITYNNNLNKIKANSSTVVFYDNTFATPWYNYFETGVGWHQVWCDDFKSLNYKMDYILSRNLGGLGIWAWGNHNNASDIEAAIWEKFHPDIIPPSVEITYPLHNRVLNQSTILIQWTGSDDRNLSRYLISIDSAGWLNMGSSTSWSVTLADGLHTISIQAYDTSDNIATDSITFQINTTIPKSPNSSTNDTNNTNETPTQSPMIFIGSLIGIGAVSISIFGYMLKQKKKNKYGADFITKIKKDIKK